MLTYSVRWHPVHGAALVALAAVFTLLAVYH